MLWTVFSLDYHSMISGCGIWIFYYWLMASCNKNQDPDGRVLMCADVLYM